MCQHISAQHTVCNKGHSFGIQYTLRCMGTYGHIRGKQYANRDLEISNTRVVSSNEKIQRHETAIVKNGINMDVILMTYGSLRRLKHSTGHMPQIYATLYNCICLPSRFLFCCIQLYLKL